MFSNYNRIAGKILLYWSYPAVQITSIIFLLLVLTNKKVRIITRYMLGTVGSFYARTQIANGLRGITVNLLK